MNADLEAAISPMALALEITLTVGRGRGYVAATDNKGPETTIGVIPVDSIFSPVRRVAVSVDPARVGQRTDFDAVRPTSRRMARHSVHATSRRPS